MKKRFAGHLVLVGTSFDYDAHLKGAESNAVAIVYFGRFNDLPGYHELGSRPQPTHGDLGILHEQVGVGFWKGEIAQHEVAIAGRPDQKHTPAHRPDSLLNAAPRDLQRDPRS